jgi:hypothetical protein
MRRLFVAMSFFIAITGTAAANDHQYFCDKAPFRFFDRQLIISKVRSAVIQSLELTGKGSVFEEISKLPTRSFIQQLKPKVESALFYGLQRASIQLLDAVTKLESANSNVDYALHLSYVIEDHLFFLREFEEIAAHENARGNEKLNKIDSGKLGFQNVLNRNMLFIVLRCAISTAERNAK